jgi:hypothetical protein
MTDLHIFYERLVTEYMWNRQVFASVLSTVFICVPFIVLGQKQSITDLNKNLDTAIISEYLPDVDFTNLDSLVKIEMIVKGNYDDANPISSERKWQFDLDNSYAYGQSISYLGDGLFSNIMIQREVTLFDLPIVLKGNAIIQNNQLNTRLSSMSFEFDYSKHVDDLMSKNNSVLINTEFDKLSSMQMALIRKRKIAELYLQKINEDGYQRAKINLIAQIDSINGYDSLYDNKYLDSLTKRLNNLNAFENRIDSIMNDNMLINNVDSAYVSLKQTIKLKEQEILQSLEEGTYHKMARKYPELSKVKNIKSALLNIPKLNIGSFRSAGTTFDVPRVPLHGISVEAKRNNLYIAGMYGVEGRQSQNSPHALRAISVFGEGREVASIKAGIGTTKRDHAHFSLTQIKNPKQESNTNQIVGARNNIVATCDARMQIDNSVFFEATGSLSSADFGGAKGASDLLNELYKNAVTGSSNFAYLIRSGWENNKRTHIIVLEYQSIGDQFVSLGNPLLIPGRSNVRINTKHQLFNKKMRIGFLYGYGIGKSSNNLYPEISQNQMSIDLSLQISKQGGRVWLNYSPNHIAQKLNSESTGSLFQFNMTSLGCQLIYPVFNSMHWTGMLQVSNFYNLSAYQDTSFLSGLWYTHFNQSIASGKYSISMTTSLGADQNDLANIRDVNMDITQSFTIGKHQFSQGFQYVRRPFDSATLFGGSIGATLHLKENLDARLNLVYWADTQSSQSNQILINTGISYAF